jgi:hypothetical protein
MHAEWFDDLFKAMSEVMHDGLLTVEEARVEQVLKERDKRRQAERAETPVS